jgi:hypothetical protein
LVAKIKAAVAKIKAAVAKIKAAPLPNRGPTITHQHLNLRHPSDSFGVLARPQFLPLINSRSSR